MFSLAVLSTALLVNWHVPSPSLSLPSRRVRPPANCAADMGSADAAVTTPASASESAASTGAAAAANEAAWWAMLGQLRAYAREFGNADAPLGNDLGRWCAAQRRVRASGRLAAAREAALDDLGFSWTSPSDVDDPVAQRDWGEMCRKFAAYRAAEGDGQVPKKYKLDPSLGGWVAAVRRARATLGEARTAELEALGFEWVSTRQCGSAFMHSFRELRAFYDEHGHTDVRRVDGDDAPLARWCAAQRKAYAKGQLPPKRSGYLDGIEFEW